MNDVYYGGAYFVVFGAIRIQTFTEYLRPFAQQQTLKPGDLQQKCNASPSRCRSHHHPHPF